LAKTAYTLYMHVNTDRRTNITAIARRFVLTNASRANNNAHIYSVLVCLSYSILHKSVSRENRSHTVAHKRATVSNKRISFLWILAD